MITFAGAGFFGAARALLIGGCCSSSSSSDLRFVPVGALGAAVVRFADVAATFVVDLAADLALEAAGLGAVFFAAFAAGLLAAGAFNTRADATGIASVAFKTLGENGQALTFLDGGALPSHACTSGVLDLAFLLYAQALLWVQKNIVENSLLGFLSLEIMLACNLEIKF